VNQLFRTGAPGHTVEDVRERIGFRALVALLLGTAGVAAGAVMAGWQLAAPGTSASALLAVTGAALATAVIALLAQPGLLGIAPLAGPLLRRTAALRRKSWAAVFQRQLNPDAAGRARPRAPTAVPAAA
jgi:hypothetical protein